jgi:toxin ParE1/3/4
LIAGAVYYAREADKQTAEAFLDEFDYAISLLTEFPGLGTLWRGGKARKFPIRRFPYSIVYYQTQSRLRVLAVAHQSRTPEYWAGRK